ncbi:MAG: response regulator transcription factor [Planctomycetaceae bacterium]
MNVAATVYIVDDDSALRDALRLLIQTAGLRVESFETPRAFLDSFDGDRPGCLVLDMHMPEIDGLDLQRRLAERGSRLPIIILTGHGDVPTAVRALRAGALDFIQKPFESRHLLERVREAIAIDARSRHQRADRAQIEARLARLTPRELEVLDRVVEGLPTKAIAADLGSRFNTVQNQRASILKKMQAESVADLVRMVMIVRAGQS